MRLFVAVNVPDDEKSRLGAVLDTLRASDLPFRWVNAESLHITLKFLGQTAGDQVDVVTAALRRAARGVASFDIRLGGFGAFPSVARARVLWLGVDAPPALAELQDRVENEIEPLGFPREKRSFSPHLTLGRLKPQAEHVDAAGMDRMTGRIGYKAQFTAVSVDLMRSHLSPRGARYETVERVLLGS